MLCKSENEFESPVPTYASVIPVLLGGWVADTGEFPEAHGQASQVHIVVNKRPFLKENGKQ